MQPIYDHNNAIIGYQQTIGQQRVLFDRNGNRLGHYQTNSNCTFDANGTFIGHGDQVMRLLR